MLSYWRDKLTKWFLRAIESYWWDSTPISVQFLASLELTRSIDWQIWLHPSEVHWYIGKCLHITINTSMTTKSHKRNQALVRSTLPSFRPEYMLYYATYWWFRSSTHVEMDIIALNVMKFSMKECCRLKWTTTYYDLYGVYHEANEYFPVK